MTEIKFEIKGQPHSKANSRRLVYFGKRPAFIKSPQAIEYEKLFAAQCPVLDPIIPYNKKDKQNVAVHMTIYYASRRPDLDESLILDCMQGRIYENDRCVKEKHIRWGLDKDNPRSEIRVIKIPPP
jgi:Holliday junction resolvase RusA-like endonuclease|tara:strand:+ start:24730 stop:25107 length:378 start_codon:yes stop_codon:yes gene_type:complete